eukprot:2009896-Prymnesium_polylepis.1
MVEAMREAYGDRDALRVEERTLPTRELAQHQVDCALDGRRRARREEDALLAECSRQALAARGAGADHPLEFCPGARRKEPVALEGGKVGVRVMGVRVDRDVGELPAQVEARLVERGRVPVDEQDAQRRRRHGERERGGRCEERAQDCEHQVSSWFAAQATSGLTSSPHKASVCEACTVHSTDIFEGGGTHTR